MSILDQTKEKISNLPEKKPVLDFVLAFLSIPVVLTVMITNINNLKSKNTSIQTNPTPTIIVKQNEQTPKIVYQKVYGEKTEPASSIVPTSQIITGTPPTNPICKKEIGPIDITFPKDNETVKDNPLCIIIKHDSNYCSVVWSYKINNGNWSEYSSNSPCLYNVPNGNITFSLRVQSTVSEDQTTIERKFNYLNPTPSDTNATSSSQIN